jgi:uncharacterized protein YyaL (SSP411 family)
LYIFNVSKFVHFHLTRDTAYVCENFACKEPVTTPERLAAQLRA